MKLIPFCPFSVAKLLALKATVLLLLTLLIKARVQIVAGSSLGILDAGPLRRDCLVLSRRCTR